MLRDFATENNHVSFSYSLICSASAAPVKKMKIMNDFPLSVFGLAVAMSLFASASAKAQNTADATLELTIRLDRITKTDTLTNSTTDAILENSSEVGDLIFEDFGPNGSVAFGGSPTNPVGSVGAATASEAILVNGLDPFIDDITEDTFGIGDSFVSTMTVTSSAMTPGSVFFGQVNSENSLFFSSFLDETDRFTFHFEWAAVLTGDLDNSLDGISLAFGDGTDVTALADSTVSGTPNEFLVASDFFNLGTAWGVDGLLQVSEIDSGSFDVAFDAGDSDLQISFRSGLIVNARVAAVPEPASGSLVLAMLVPLAIRRRRSS